jgi:lipopolysaccharide transport system permease protein
MSVQYLDRKIEVVGQAGPGPALRIRFRLSNLSGETWKNAGGFAVGYHVFDPETGTLIVDGGRTQLARDLSHGESDEIELSLELPPEPGCYRVFISPLQEDVCWYYERGWRFLLIDALVENHRAKLLRSKVTTTRALRFEGLSRSVGKAFRYPFLTVWNNGSLIRSMVRRDILGRYRGSFGGILWTVLNPLLLMLTYFFVFGIVLQARFGEDPSRAGFVLYFLAGMLPWLAFSEAAGRAPFIILEYRNFVKKLVFPVETLPVNLVISGLVTEAFALVIFSIGLLLARGSVPLSVCWLPVLVIPQLLFTMGICWFLAGLGVFVRDLGQINGFLLTLWFFLTPICYPEESLRGVGLQVLSKNPIFVLVRGYRDIFLEHHAPAFSPMWKLWVVAAAACILGHAWFYKLRKHFADVI